MSPTSGNDSRDFPRGRRVAAGVPVDGVAEGSPPGEESADRPLSAMERLRLAQGIAAPSSRPDAADDDALRPRTGERTLPFGDAAAGQPPLMGRRAQQAAPHAAQPAARPPSAPTTLPEVADVVAAALGQVPESSRPDRAPGWRARRVAPEETAPSREPAPFEAFSPQPAAPEPPAPEPPAPEPRLFESPSYDTQRFETQRFEAPSYEPQPYETQPYATQGFDPVPREPGRGPLAHESLTPEPLAPEPFSSFDATAAAASAAEEVSLSAVVPSRPPLNPVPEVVTPSESVAAELADLTAEPMVTALEELTPSPDDDVTPPPVDAHDGAPTGRAARRSEARARRAELGRQRSVPEAVVEPESMSRRTAAGVSACGVLVLAGTAALVLAVLGIGPEWVDGAGAVSVVTGMAGLLAVRTNGQPWVSTAVALALGVAAVVSEQPVLATGAAVATCVVGGVYAVMATVPAVTFGAAAREVLWATLLSVVVALAVVGFEPTASVEPFEITTLLLAVAVVMALVYRLGAGLHGLGRRGTVVIAIGFGLLAGAIAYAELLRRYGAPGVVESVLDLVAWSQVHLYAFPRPLVVVLGIPALAWGAHMRARRRQGWWVAAFGVAATVPVATSLLGVEASLLGALVRASYSLVCGLVLAWLVVWFDLRLTGPRGAGARRVEEASAHRPEPSRWSPL